MKETKQFLVYVLNVINDNNNRLKWLKKNTRDSGLRRRRVKQLLGSNDFCWRQAQLINEEIKTQVDFNVGNR